MSNLHNDKKKMLIFFIPAIFSFILALWLIGFGVNFFIILILWIIVYILFFVRSIITSFYIFLLVIGITLIFSILVSYKVIFNGTSTSTSKYEKTADGIYLATCTSTANDKPQMVSGFKSTLYAAIMDKSTSNNSRVDNGVRTFSYSGITNKTDKNSLYSRIEKTDESSIEGYGAVMEVCTTSDNKTNLSYATVDATYKAGQNVVATESYLHGGKYLHGAGNYRIDVYLRTLDNKWHLIDRLTGITVTN